MGIEAAGERHGGHWRHAMVSDMTPLVHPSRDAPAPASSLRGWDIFTGVGLACVFLSVLAMDEPAVWWAPPWCCAAVWYIVIGRRALITGRLRWARVYAAGAAILMLWGAVVDPWLNPWVATVVPLIWWLFLPDRRRAVLWTAAQCVGLVAGMIVFQSLFEPNAWSQQKTVVYLVGFPILIIAASIVGGRWVEAVFNWGRERALLVRDLRSTEQQRIELAREAAAADERLRLAQEIHDTIAQDVAGLRLLVQQARRQADVVASPHKPLDRTLSMISTATDTVLTQTRVLITTTMPVLDSSFPEAVDRIVTRFSNETGIVINADVTDVRLSREAEVAFVRCLQEGLSNVRRHAQASQVWVSISETDDTAVMTLTDNGVGMAAGASRGFGLPGMAERVRLAGGSFTIESPGARLGVTMRVRMPMAERASVAPDLPLTDQREVAS